MSTALAEVRRRFGSVLLPQAYPEGSPTHPACPAGHTVIAGACATVLKACLDESHVVPEPIAASPDGTKLATSSAGLRLGLHRFEASSGPGELEAFEISLRADRSHAVTPDFRVFVGGGGGAYFFDPGDTEAGVHAVVGAGWRINPRVDLEVRADHQEILDGAPDFGTIQAGLRVRL